MYRLESELERLKKASGKGEELQLRWVPDANSAKEGEVCGRTVYIYSETVNEAVKTLRHEFFDYLICKAIEPYQEIVNGLLAILSEKAYRKKEKIVESILSVLESSPSHKDLAVL
ncbi:MAG: hypothetical protein KGI33_10480 [Thaumarchaeota archaeon]|nr:hypothetical protein [Nitrososphaerota archaeon]